ncbi:MAG: prolyl oligopeptidase family serine peptidase [Pirellulales bacterium]
MKWKSSDGLEIEGVLTLPPEKDGADHAPYPLIVYPHGGPHSASKPGFNFTVHLFAAYGYAVFQPNFRGTYGYGRQFLDAARFDMGGSDMQDILTGIDMLVARGTVDRHRQFVYGISYGGYTSCRLVTLTNQFRAAAAQNAVTDLHAMWSLSDLQSWTEWEFGGKPWETVEHDGRKIDVGALMRRAQPDDAGPPSEDADAHPACRSRSALPARNGANVPSRAQGSRLRDGPRRVQRRTPRALASAAPGRRAGTRLGLVRRARCEGSTEDCAA